MRHRLAVALALVASAAFAVPAAGDPAHVPPQGPAKVAFAADFPPLVDHEWGFALGGFGGVARGAPRTHVPVIFVHGNTVDAADWYPVRDDFRAAGWTDQELWALSYNGLGGNSGIAVKRSNPEAMAEHREMGWDGQVRITNNEVNVPDLYDFVVAVRAYTGSDRFAIVAHSLGVTLARRTLKVHPELRADLVAFVGIAGGNHGTSLCPPGSQGNVVSCDEVAAGTPWLADLNGPDGSDETYAPAKWLTVYDGSGAGDPAFAGPTYAPSPSLDGADNRTFPGTYHNDLRVDAPIVAEYRDFVAAAEQGAAGPASTPGAPAVSSTAPDDAAETSHADRPARPARPAAVIGTPVAPATAASANTVAATAPARTSSSPGAVALPTRRGRSGGGGRKPGAVDVLLVLTGAAGAALLAIDRRRHVRVAA